MAKTHLSKQVTRDFSLYMMQWWRVVMRDRFKKYFSACYNEYFAVHDGFSATFYCTEQDAHDVKQAVLSTLARDDGFYEKHSKTYRVDSERSREILKKLHGKELSLKDIRLLGRRFSLIFPMLRVTFFTPSVWLDDFRNRVGHRADKFIAVLYRDRIYTEGIFEDIDATLRKFAAKKLERQGINGSLAKFLTVEELEGLATGARPNKAALSKRAKGFVYCEGEVLVGADAKKLLASKGYMLPQEVLPTEKTLKGSVAFDGGTVTGKARLVRSHEEVASFRQGEVLVSAMTIPDFVPAIKKAIAIVTDEGGITCHAAIVSREMKIPCVVGTKHASRLFKNGDTIIVDSSKGTVTKK